MPNLYVCAAIDQNEELLEHSIRCDVRDVCETLRGCGAAETMTTLAFACVRVR